MSRTQGAYQFFSVSTFIVVEQSDKKLYTSYLFYKYNK